MSLRVLGADACKAGWIGVLLEDGAVTVHFGQTIAALAAGAEAGGQLAVVGIDIPIGLPDTGAREADLLAREFLGRSRRASVFMTPVRAALHAASHAEAGLENTRLAGTGVSAQAYGLRSKIMEVDIWVRQRAELRVVEVHPEVSFAAMAGAALPDGKRTWAGAQHRSRLLAEQGILFADEIGEAGRRGAVDDVLDAAAAAWTARRVASGEATSLPHPPVEYSDRWPAAIWY